MRHAEFTKLQKLLRICTHAPSIFLPGRQYIFVLSHMRSYSTVLCHILASSEEVSGYCENHLAYSSFLDLAMLRARVFIAHNGTLSGRYVLDKLLQDYCTISQRVLRKRNLKLIFLLRKPEDTLKSLVAVSRRLRDSGWSIDPRAAAAYYCARLEGLTSVCRRARGEPLYIESERVVSDSANVLKALGDYLDLRAPLSESYSDFTYTGRKWYGDSSESIRAGKIVKHRSDHKDILIPKPLLNRATQAYSTCAAFLKQNCWSV